MIKNIFFDLDGTLTDSSEGITKCAKISLEHFGINGYEQQDLKCFIGPPLRDTYVKFGIKRENIEEAIEVFRARYNTIGKFENVPYEGISQLLDKLVKKGHKLYVATSKPEVTARQIMDKFELTKYFDMICGATLDGSRDSKESVISYLLDNILVDKTLSQKDIIGDVIMVGDTKYDVIGAKAFGINTIGVSWGFGSTKEMLDAGAVKIVDTMDELFEFVIR